MITRAQMQRQLRSNGGIMTVKTIRKKYGIGSELKDFVRKIIPNEIADVAVKAAPFVAPFYPGTAALMRGIGRFDQRGSMSDALKQGALTYVGGRGVRALAGAKGPAGGFDTFTKKGFREGPIGKLFQGGRGRTDANTMSGSGYGTDDTRKGVDIIQRGTDATINKVPGLRALPDFVKQQLFVGGITSGATALYEYFKGGFRPQEEGETIEDYLAARKEAVGTQMRTYMDNYFKFDKEYSTMTDAERDAFVARYNVRDGGRVGFQEGGMDPDYDIDSMRDPFAPMSNVSSNPFSRETIMQNIFKDIEPGFENENSIARMYPDQFRTGLNVDYLKTLTPDEIKLALDNAYLQGENFQNPDFSTGRIGRGSPFFRYGPEYMKSFNMRGSPLQLSDRYTAYNLRNELGELESILGKEAIKPYRTKLEDALMDYYKIDMSGDTDLQKRIFGPTTTAPTTTAPTTAAPTTAAPTTTGIQTIPTDKKVFNVMLDEKGNVMKDQSLTELFRETGTAPQIGIGGPASINSMSDVFRLAGITGEDGISMGTDYSGTTLPSGGEANTLPRSINMRNTLQENLAANEAQRSANQRVLEAARARLPGAGIMNAPVDVMLPTGPNKLSMLNRGDFAKPVTLDGQQFTNEADAIAGLGVERYNQLMATGGRVGFALGGNELPPDPTAPVNPFKPKPIGPVLPNKEVASDEISIEKIEMLIKRGADNDLIKEFTGASDGVINQIRDVMKRKKQAGGGVMSIPVRTNSEGIRELDMRKTGGFVPIGVKEKADDVPAMLSKNEFVMTADAVRAAGGGSVQKGAQKMYDTMKKLESRVA